MVELVPLTKYRTHAFNKYFFLYLKTNVNIYINMHHNQFYLVGVIAALSQHITWISSIIDNMIQCCSVVN